MFSQKAIERVKFIDKKINFVNTIISEKDICFLLVYNKYF